MSCGDICLALLAVIFPPIAVWIKRGLCSLDSLLNLCLCLLGYLPGLIHAWYVIARYPDPDDDDGTTYEYQRIRDAEAGRGVTYYYVSHDRMQGPPSNPGSAPASPWQQPQQTARTPNHQRTPTGAGLAPQPGQGQEQGVTGTGGPDGGHAHRELQRGTSLGSMRQNGEGASGSRPPPSYAEAIQGDNKVQS